MNDESYIREKFCGFSGFSTNRESIPTDFISAILSARHLFNWLM